MNQRHLMAGMHIVIFNLIVSLTSHLSERNYKAANTNAAISEKIWRVTTASDVTARFLEYESAQSGTIEMN